MIKNPFMRKKGESLSMNVIVVAVIALIVLIVIIVVFSGQFGNFTKGVNSCKDKGGEEVSGTSADCIAQGGSLIGPYYDTSTGKKSETSVCCKKG
jgi:hypothetical protein